MKIENKVQEEVVELLNNAENKSEAIVEAIEKLNEAAHADLIKELEEQNELAKSDEQYAKSLGLRVLNKEEKLFYEKITAEQSITADQIDIIPTSIIDRTLDDVKKESGILSLINFAPANVKKWLVASKSGTYAWGSLTSAIAATLEATITSLNIEVSKLSVAMVIPKAIRDLALPFVDKYFTAILNETITDGAEYGFLLGTGKDEPIGIYKQIDNVNQDGTHADKVLLTNITNFTPKGLAPVKKGLSNNGKRTFSKIALICNPADEADYVAPALYDAVGNMISSYKNLEVMQSANNPQGKAVFVLPKMYVMGFSGFKVNEYDQTKALDDADLIIAKAYANGRAVDDNCAIAFDVTKLEEFVRTVKVVGNTTTATETVENSESDNAGTGDNAGSGEGAGEGAGKGTGDVQGA